MDLGQTFWHCGPLDRILHFHYPIRFFHLPITKIPTIELKVEPSEFYTFFHDTSALYLNPVLPQSLMSTLSSPSYILFVYTQAQWFTYALHVYIRLYVWMYMTGAICQMSPGKIGNISQPMPTHNSSLQLYTSLDLLNHFHTLRILRLSSSPSHFEQPQQMPKAERQS